MWNVEGEGGLWYFPAMQVKKKGWSRWDLQGECTQYSDLFTKDLTNVEL